MDYTAIMQDCPSYRPYTVLACKVTEIINIKSKKHNKMSNNKQILLRAMLCTIWLIFSGYTVASAQITLSLKNKSVREAIRNIEKTSDYRFFYNDDLPGLDTSISIQVEEGTITAVMNLLTQQADIAYAIRDNNQIVLSAGTVSLQQTGRRITGTVNDENGELITGANVVEKGTVNGTVTDVNGHFSLEVPADGAVLQVSYIGYITQDISVPSISGGGGG
jgi:hypothetical protein